MDSCLRALACTRGAVARAGAIALFVLAAAATTACTGELVASWQQRGDDGGIPGGPDAGAEGGDAGLADPAPCETLDRGAVPGRVAPLEFSERRGFYDAPFDLVIDTATEGAVIAYTTDGSRPSDSNGTREAAPVTLPITTTSVVRAVAMADGLEPSWLETHTFLFVDDVLAQPRAVTGYPAPTMGAGSGTTVELDYEMDPQVVGDPAYADSMRASLLAIPTLSIVMAPDDMFGADGVYINGSGAGGDNGEYERSASIELIYPDRPQRNVQADASVRPHSHVVVKRSLRLSFREEFGTKKLRSCIFRDSPLNGDSAAIKFDRIVLRAGTNRSWAMSYNADDTVYTREQWMHDAQLAVSGIGSHGTFVHLYINGLYWGLYNPIERPDAWFASAYYGGEKEDWFAVNHGGPIHGDSSRFDYLKGTLVNRDMSNPDNYAELGQYVDIDQYIDYLVLNFYAGNDDWPGNNWYAFNRNNPPAPMKFMVWDAEDTWDGEASSGPYDQEGGRGSDGAWVHPAFRPGSSNSAPIAKIWRAARKSPDFVMRFADRVYALCFNGGPLTGARTRARWQALADFIELAVLGESARWGDTRAPFGEPTRTRDDSWQPEVDRVLEVPMSGNSDRLVAALREYGYYPAIDPPVLNQHGGEIASGFALELTNPNSGGEIYFTLDGTDPRQPGGGLAGGALLYSAPTDIPDTAHVLARVRDGSIWSALADAEFAPSP